MGEPRKFRFIRISMPPAAPAPQPGPATSDVETWEVGDVAECTFVGPWISQTGAAQAGPRFDERNRVAAMPRVCNCPNCRSISFLCFTAFPGIWFASVNFRKVRPQADALVAAEGDFLDRWIGEPGLIAAIKRWHRRAGAKIASLVTAALLSTIFCLVIAPAIAAYAQGTPQ